jgi:hypothetical protein
MKVLILCSENPKICIEVLDELELFIDKRVIFDEIFFLRRSDAAVCRPPSDSKFCNPYNFFFSG